MDQTVFACHSQLNLSITVSLPFIFSMNYWLTGLLQLRRHCGQVVGAVAIENITRARGIFSNLSVFTL